MGSFHSSGNIFPRTISISIEFKVLHEQIPGKAGAPTGFYGDGSGLKLNDKTPHKSGQTAGLPGWWMAIWRYNPVAFNRGRIDNVKKK